MSSIVCPISAGDHHMRSKRREEGADSPIRSTRAMLSSSPSSVPLPPWKLPRRGDLLAAMNSCQPRPVDLPKKLHVCDSPRVIIFQLLHVGRRLASCTVHVAKDELPALICLGRSIDRSSRQFISGYVFASFSHARAKMWSTHPVERHDRWATKRKGVAQTGKPMHYPDSSKRFPFPRSGLRFPQKLRRR
jgi:hypothetical protein